jgi:hypothetical protein
MDSLFYFLSRHVEHLSIMMIMVVLSDVKDVVCVAAFDVACQEMVKIGSCLR